MKLLLITAYTPEDEGLSLKDISGGDYSHVALFDKDTGDLIHDFGDYYHNKGHIAMEAFLEGAAWAGLSFGVWECSAKTKQWEYHTPATKDGYVELSKPKHRRRK